MKTYTTKDFYLSSLLMSNGFKLINSEKKIEGVYFIFENFNEELLNKLLDDFINCKAMVNMRKFTSSLSRLRKELDKYKN
jgi:hypothetical protein